MAIRNVPGTYSTIAAAIAAAQAGDTIAIAAGYAGNESATVTVNNLFFSAPSTVAGIFLTAGAGVATITLSGNSTIQVNGNAAANVIVGDTGANRLFGMAGNDRLSGGDGDDWVVGGAGNDTLDGGAGFDVTMYEDATTGVTVNLLTGTASDGLGGTDTLTNIEAVHGGRFADTLTLSNTGGYAFGRAGNDKITGGTSDDRFYGGSGNDTLDGSAGVNTADYRDDTYDTAGVGGSGVTVNLATGKATDNWGNTDTLLNIENVSGSGLADTITGNANGNYLFGQAGNDTIIGGAGDDSMMGGAGNDRLDGGDGLDGAVYEAATAAVTVNLLTGTASDGEGGTDTLISVEGVRASRFADTVTLSNAAGYAFGRAGNDRITGGAGNDTLYGGSGNDTLNGGAGTSDWASYPGNLYDTAPPPTKGVTVNLVTGKANDNWGNADTLVNIENVYGSSLVDTITGDANRNILWGDAGNDSISGGGGNDDLYGGDGNDTLVGGLGVNYFQGNAGNDRFDGGTGYDFAFWDKAQNYDIVDYRTGPTAGVVVNLATGKASDGQGGTDTLINIEQVYGSAFNDVLTGGGEARFQSFRGGAGNDKITGSGKINTRADYSDSTGGVTITLSGAADGLGTATGGSTGTDTLRYVNQFYGSNYNDTYDVSAYTLSMPSAGNGFNVFRGGGGNDTIIGNGNTRLDFGSATTGITLNLGLTTVADGQGGVDTFSGVNAVAATAYDDTLTGTGADENFNGGGGNDTIIGGGGSDEARYDTGTSPITKGITVNMATGIVDGDPVYAGHDTLSGIEAIRGSLLADVYVATGFASGDATGTFRDGPLVNKNYNRFAGLSGNDKITGNGQTSLDYRGASAAVTAVFTARGKGTVVGTTEGTDTFTGVYSIQDSAYDDVLTGSNVVAADYWEGFNLSGGNDTVTGGSANDYISYSYAPNAAVIVTFSGVGAGTVTGNGNDVFSGISYIIGSQKNDKMTGGAGNETFAGLSGNDTLDGGAGTGDTVTYFFDRAGATVNLTAGTAKDGSGGTDRLLNFENVTGSVFNDTITGNAAANLLDGLAGDDKLDGKAGADTMKGGAGNDTYVVDNIGDQAIEAANQGTDLVTASVNFTLGANVENLTLLGSTALTGTGNTLANVLTGNAGANTLNGLTGNDRLDGKTGKDTLTGGGGVDTFAFTTALGSANVDTLTDFVSGTDRIELSSAIFAALPPGALSAAAFVQATAATTASQHILYNKTTGVVSYDADGNGAGAAVAFAQLTAGQTLKAGDFTVV